MKSCLDCAKCIPAKKVLYVHNGKNYGFRQNYTCKEKKRHISKKFFEVFPQKYNCFVPKGDMNEI